MALNKTRNTQVITVLSGPTTLSGLLGILIAAYPDAGWDEATLLTVLTQGAAKGRYTRVQCVPVVVWDLRTDMVAANPNNAIYQDANSRIVKRAAQCTASFSTFYEPAVPNTCDTTDDNVNDAGDGAFTSGLVLVGGR